MVSPATNEELAEVVRTGCPWRITGLGTKSALCLDSETLPGAARSGDGQGIYMGTESETLPPEPPGDRGEGRVGGLPGPARSASARGSEISTLALQGIIDWSPNDQVVVVRAGTPLSALQEELRKQGQCVPLPSVEDVGPLPAGLPGTVGGLVAMNLPHALQGSCGGVRDWVLGLTLVRADGAIARCGSRVVKNVAGYDVQKLMVGSRGTLGVIVEVVLRTFPLRALPAPAVTGEGEIVLERAWIQRTLRADFIDARAAARRRPHRADEASSTLWADVGPDESPPRFAEDWVLAPGREPLPEGPMREWMRRTKNAFDPDARLNPGAMGAW